MPNASERPYQSFLFLRASEIHWPSGWSTRTSPDQIVWLQISRDSVHRLFQARRLRDQSSQGRALRPLARRLSFPQFSCVFSLFDSFQSESDHKKPNAAAERPSLMDFAMGF